MDLPGDTGVRFTGSDVEHLVGGSRRHGPDYLRHGLSDPVLCSIAIVGSVFRAPSFRYEAFLP